MSKELNKLKLKYNLWMVPFYFMRLPLVMLVLFILFWEYVVRFGDYCEDKIYSIRDKWIDLTEPPKWYPTQDCLKKAQDIKEELHKERLKKLYQHNIVKEGFHN